MRFAYNVLFFLFSIVYVPVFIAKWKFSEGWATRFGFLPAALKNALLGKRVFWLHAVSVGEIGLAVRFADSLREREPGVQVLLTTTTVTGYAVAKKIMSPDDLLAYFPVDWPMTVSAFVDQVSPESVLFFETEIWPNLLRTLKTRSIPTYIINGRLSDKAYKKYLKVRGFMRNVLSDLTAIGAQDERMAERFLALGADPAIVRKTGNLKFEAPMSSPLSGDLHSLAQALKHGSASLWVAGSTREGEEMIICECYRRLKEAFPEWRLLLAPRHLVRLDAIEKELGAQGWTVRRVSAQHRPRSVGDKDIFLLDELGVLASLYQAADLVFVGGSLAPIGGHNPVEPARFGRAVLFGPHMENFRTMAEEFCREGAAVQVSGADELSDQVRRLAGDPEARSRMGEKARELILKHRGAAERNLELVLGMSFQEHHQRILS